MGRRKGEPLVRLAEVEVVSVLREPLRDMTHEDLALEGFPDWTLDQFWDFFRETHKGCTLDTEVTRIRWRYLDGEPDQVPV